MNEDSVKHEMERFDAHLRSMRRQIEGLFLEVDESQWPTLKYNAVALEAFRDSMTAVLFRGMKYNR